MKKLFFLVSGVLLLTALLFIDVEAQNPYYWTVKVRNLLQVQSTGSLDVDGSADFGNGLTISSGNLAVTSGNLSVGGTTTFSNRTIFAAAVTDTNAFTGTATVDTVVVTGATVSSIFLVSGMFTAGVDQQDVLQWEARTDSLFVHRLAAGESGLKYSWLWVK